VQRTPPKSARLEEKEKPMSIRNDARILCDRAEEAIRRNPHAVPDPDFLSEMQRVLAEGKSYYISDLHPELDWRRWPIPERWTLESIRDLACAIHETGVRHDNATGPALAKARLTGI
jgi:hypothetical protein